MPTGGSIGHCLRAYAYFKDELPLIQQADPLERCFKITIGDTEHYIKEGTLINTPQGEQLIEDYYQSNN